MTTKKLTAHQEEVLQRARANNGRVYAADYYHPNASGRGATGRELASFYRTVRVLVRLGLLRRMESDRGFTGAYELVDFVREEKPAPAPRTDLTPGMVDFLKYRVNKNGDLDRHFHTGRGGACSTSVAKALQSRGYAELVREHTWETDWRLTDAAVAAWHRYRSNNPS